ncbi:glycosyltransferase [Thalassobius sp. S69A]|uniref:glycosyltransferase n=1 Tax=unclassified Thalassovita TaxID=2619711 RepID=UPI003C7C095C
MTLQERILFHPRTHWSFGQYLMDRGVIGSAHMLRANAERLTSDADLGEVLIALGALSPDSYADRAAEWMRTSRATPAELTPNLQMLDHLGPRFCLRYGILPLGERAGLTYIATARPESFQKLLPDLPTDWGVIQPVAATLDDIQAVIAQTYRDQLTYAAQTRTPDFESCRSWENVSRQRVWLSALAILSLLALTVLYPIAVFTTITAWAAFAMLVSTVIKVVSFLAYLTNRADPTPPPHVPPDPHYKRPRISILVPLYRETEIARVLLRRLTRLTYPKSLLDVVLVLEENDTLTREAVAEATLPHWMRVVVVPDGAPKTKPRAMNYALDFCDGDIIGIFDAEDAPEPDQLDKVAEQFRTAPADVVCLQGVLDYYNARQNWMARCFTIEYAAWFRVIMPGLQQLGFALPLGGTTLYFRREPLEELGGWDAHNVTEDADLGFRLARHGYRTAMLDSTTREEANCRPLPWVKQRSRWLKGYMVTYMVHMRAPARLFRDLGAWKFLGFQAHFITAMSCFLLAPFLWSNWLMVFGLYHPLTEVVSGEWIRTMAIMFFTVELCNIGVGLVAVSGPAHRHLLAWVPSMHFYYPLGILAAYKALYELVCAPFYWDKTEHGHSLQTCQASGAPPPASGGSVQLEPGHERL